MKNQSNSPQAQTLGKRIRNAILPFLLGAVAVAIFVPFAMNDSGMNAYRSTQQASVEDWEIRAFKAYKNNKKEAAIWAFENIDDFIDENRKYFFDYGELNIITIRIYGRLALLYRASNNEEKYRQYIDKAIVTAKSVSFNEATSEESLLGYIKKMDSHPRGKEEIEEY